MQKKKKLEEGDGAAEAMEEGNGSVQAMEEKDGYGWTIGGKGGWESTLENYGWTHTYPSSDPVHFDYSNVKDLAKENLVAFQKLWNKNNPNSPIAEDGIYGKDTESAFYNTPCDGWWNQLLIELKISERYTY